MGCTMGCRGIPALVPGAPPAPPSHVLGRKKPKNPINMIASILRMRNLPCHELQPGGSEQGLHIPYNKPHLLKPNFRDLSSTFIYTVLESSAAGGSYFYITDLGVYRAVPLMSSPCSSLAAIT
ncbi:hypothetical protein DUI87_05995 [Hirundo rustica rustica]|uniref:Uncharacterized protein n=1 Tax=Hirundo rustica rustica TaxID=333673 RepID=A0A3M0L0W0_HIRRU|nr:hypothetical protein DUI87_05995 [Hirundo rustica rustica]